MLSGASYTNAKEEISHFSYFQKFALYFRNKYTLNIFYQLLHSKYFAVSTFIFILYYTLQACFNFLAEFLNFCNK